jgi:hypothetical protein
MTTWINAEYDEESGEIVNPEWTSAPDDSFWWIDDASMLHKVLIKTKINGYPSRIARVWHPDEVNP